VSAANWANQFTFGQGRPAELSRKASGGGGGGGGGGSGGPKQPLIGPS